jgi:two-component system, chemotaxis family, chemotaxis protein CheY
MKALIVEDNLTSWLFLHELLKPYAEIQTAANGQEAVEAYQESLDANEPYALICLDIIMPEMDGHQALKEIRRIEDEHGISADRRARVIMTSSLTDKDNVVAAFRELCDAYLMKPISKKQLIYHLQRFGLIK